MKDLPFMICPHCLAATDANEPLCDKCGASLVSSLPCPHCQAANPPGSRYCDQCGTLLTAKVHQPARLRSERKHVSVLFTDINRYPEIINRVDPEEIRDVTRHLFEETARIVSRYDGHVDRVQWDGVLAIFGMPQTHEDDAIRAIHAAVNVQRMASRLEKRYAGQIGGSLAMRCGVATGLVVTGTAEEKTGQHGITGETVNLAARIRDMARPGEVLVDSSAYASAAGYFSFDPRKPVTVKGLSRPVQVYRVLSVILQPDKVRRIQGLRARMVGRDAELKQLEDAALRLRRNEGTVATVSGDAGTGKSRLLAEFKESFSARDIRWLDGHAFDYNAGVPYYPFIDMLNRLFDIHEADGQAVIHAKLQSGLGLLVGDLDAVVPFLAALYTDHSAAALEAGPEVYKSRLHNAFVTLFSVLSRQGPTIVCIEDLHWADPSSLALLRFLLTESGLPILFVISYRPTVDVFRRRDLAALSYSLEEIRLGDLDTDSAREMVRSLMDTPIIPVALDRYLFPQVEGNPFYLEEVVNSLLDNQCLTRVGDQWQLDETFSVSDVSSSINGIIHGRLDRLGATAKGLLQEASVIGRVFRLDLLERITDHPEELDACIEAIAGVDLIRPVEASKESAFSFKHALVQEVVYKSLLKKDRRRIHERIARTLEAQYQGRLDSVPEFLALHYANSDCAHKAAEYLIRSGEKSLEKYSVEESHRYYERAYQLLDKIERPTRQEQGMLIDLIIKWYFALNKRGLFREMLDLLRSHEAAVKDFGDTRRTAMYEVCMGWAMQRRELLPESYAYLIRALDAGQQLGDDLLVGYSCACLCWTCTDLGRMDEALSFGRQASRMAERIGSDHELIRFNLTGMGLLHFYSGDLTACWDAGEQLLAFGEKEGDIRTFSEGYLLMGTARMAAGDFADAETLLSKAIDVSVDPIYSLNARFFLSYAYFSQGKVAIAARTLEAVIEATSAFGYEFVGTSANAFYGIVTAAMGNLEEGTNLIREQIQRHRRRGKCNHDLIFTHMLGKFYLSLLRPRGRLNFKTLFTNFRFLLRTLPVAARLAEHYLQEAVEIGTRIEANIRLAKAHLDLGLLYTHRKRHIDARSHLLRAIDLFDRCGAQVYLEQAREALDRLPHA